MRISTWQIFACLVYNNTCKYHQITFRIFVIMSFHKRITKKICSTPFPWYLWHTFTRDVSKTIWHFRYYGHDPKVIRAFCNLHILIVIFTYVRKISILCTHRELMYRNIRFIIRLIHYNNYHYLIWCGSNRFCITVRGNCIPILLSIVKNAMMQKISFSFDTSQTV